MTDLRFRGKDFDTGEWVTGFYVCFNGEEHRIYNGYAETDCGDYYPDWWKVDSQTVGLSTGEGDMNGKEVFAGDIIENPHGMKMVIHYGTYQAYCPVDEVYVDCIGFYAEAVGLPHMPIGTLEDYAKVIGNIHDNPEILNN